MHVVILAASTYAVAEPFAGGLESLTWHLARGLADRGIEVSLFAAPGSDPALGAVPLDVAPLQLTDAARQDVSMVPERWLREHHAYLQVLVALQGRRDVDVVHNNSLHHLPVAMASSLPAPVLTTLHTPPTPWLEPAIAIDSGATAGGPGRPHRRNSHYVAVSEHTARAWSHVVQPGVVHNGVDTGRWLPGAGGPDLAWAGRLVPEKAPHRAIAVARAAGRRLRLAGPVGDPAYFVEVVAPLLGDGIEHVGHLDSRGLADLFGSSAVTLVTPEWDEPYGLVAAESLACGTPVVALDRGGLREFVSPSVGVLLPPASTAAEGAVAVEAAAALDRRDCRDHAIAHCSVTRMVDDYVALYHALSSVQGAA
ncbi:glycosyltransferase [Terrabacter sp. NPDC000476]|uniref:glycosyltransferase n=1 Tax=Terrabacter sp. NPDC000476 TaxID=3154258 RepID=UPI0033270B64